MSPKESEVMSLFACDTAPIICVLDDYLVSEQQRRLAAGKQRVETLYLRHDMWVLALLELRKTFKTLSALDVLFIADCEILPVTITEEAINRNPAIQYFFYIDRLDRKIYGI